MSAVEVVQIVEAVEEARKRIPVGQRPGITYFSVYDVWLFQAVQDTKTCSLCNHYETWGEITGNMLRHEFPYLEIMDENTIKANIHPHCRCFLVRKLY